MALPWRKKDDYTEKLLRDSGSEAGLNDSGVKPAEPSSRTSDNFSYSPESLAAAEQSSAKIPDSISSTPGSIAKNENSLYAPPKMPRTKNTNAKALGKRKSWLVGGIAGVIIGGAGIFGLGYLPGATLVNFKEIMVGKFGSNVESVIDARSQKVWVKKLSSSSKTPGIKGLCAGAVKVACRFDGMSERSVTKLKERSGIDVELDSKKNVLGRRQVKSITFTDTDGTRRTLSNAAEYSTEIKRNPALRSQLNKVFKSRFAAWTGTKIKNLFNKLKVSKGKGVSAETDTEKAKEKISERQKGEGVDIEADKVKPGEGEDLSDADKNKNSVVDKLSEDIKNGKSMSRTSTSVFKTLSKGVGVIGAADVACTALNTLSAVGYASKVIGSVQLIRFAMTFMNTADAVKAGEATTESIQVLGEMLTDTVASDDRTAFDSYGYQYAAYGMLGDSTDTMEFKNGGGLSGTLLDIRNQISNATGGLDKGACGFIQNPITRVASAVIGIVAGIFSAGSVPAANIAISASISLIAETARQFAMPLIASMLTGDYVGPNTVGNSAGNALVSGSGALYSQNGNALGLQPLSKQQAVAFDNTTRKDYVAWYRENERKESSPFDIYNPYSALGSVATIITPYTTGSFIQNITKVASTVFNPFSMISKASAAEDPTAQYDVCMDEEYAELGIATDPFCNPVYGLSNEALNMDPDTVIEDMYNGGYISPDGSPQGNYKDFVDKCVNNTEPLGVNTGEDQSIKTKDCVPSSSSYPEMFWVYNVDDSVYQQMDCLVDDDNDSCNDSSEASSPAINDDTSTSGTWVNPLADKSYRFPTYGEFGNNAGFRKGMVHDGQDMSIARGTEYTAAADGTVIFVGVKSWGTPYIVIDNGGGVTTHYGHSMLKDIKVKVGDKVTAGQVIATVNGAGTTSVGLVNNAFGPHLHFAVYTGCNPSLYGTNTSSYGGKATDPIAFMKQKGVNLAP